MAQIHAIGAEWVALMPYAYGPGSDGRIIFGPDGHQYWGERPTGVRAMVRMAKARGMKVMLKPHLWLGHGEFTGTYVPDSRFGWGPFEESYAAYVLSFAELAQELDVDMFCIGTEMETFVTQRTGYWQILIDRITEVYKGPLTYAANWDEIERFPLWKRMSFIGVDGYFPLTGATNPSVKELVACWQVHVGQLEDLSKRLERPVLFTEMGYTCAANCAAQPWTEERHADRSEQAQANAYRAFFQVFKDKPWYAGCFVWKWFAQSKDPHGREVIGFTPQGKLALRTLTESFK